MINSVEVEGDWERGYKASSDYFTQLLANASTEIWRLQAERDELLAALQEIEFHGGPAADYARAAIAKVEGK
jgi:ABC-type transporter Mla subunit MlaD